MCPKTSIKKVNLALQNEPISSNNTFYPGANGSWHRVDKRECQYSQIIRKQLIRKQLKEHSQSIPQQLTYLPADQNLLIRHPVHRKFFFILRAFGGILPSVWKLRAACQQQASTQSTASQGFTIGIIHNRNSTGANDSFQSFSYFNCKTSRVSYI